jgi:hypothetical protein
MIRSALLVATMTLLSDPAPEPTVLYAYSIWHDEDASIPVHSVPGSKTVASVLAVEDRRARGGSYGHIATIEKVFFLDQDTAVGFIARSADGFYEARILEGKHKGKVLLFWPGDLRDQRTGVGK